MTSVLSKIKEIGIIPVINIDDPDDAIMLGKALIDGGVPVAEITFRTSAAEESIRRITSEIPDLLVGAGTVVNNELAKKATNAGASFVVSPGFNPDTVKWCLDNGIDVFPGINNPSQIEKGLSMGLEVFKFFPAEVSGGAAMIKALSAPFKNVKFIPTGGINTNNISDYAVIDSVIAIGGSWMVKSELIRNKEWENISCLCRDVRLKSIGFSFAHMGINANDSKTASSVADFFSYFNLSVKEGASSIFASESIEIMKNKGLGRNGHIGISCYNIERALAYLAQWDIKGLPDTVKEDEKGVKVIYLDKEINGFAVHLLRV